jgi:hypothetical protein
MAPLLDVTAGNGRRSPAPIAGKIPPAGGGRSLKVDRVPAADDSDTATRQTVGLMCEYIRKAAADRFVQQCAKTAWRRFGRSSLNPTMKAWAAYWWVKHCIKFRLDEATMFQVGEKDQQDLLLSPSVLFRMDKPSEDCDGFTMALGALLVCLGVPVVIATVAADAGDKTRWSHVFLVSIINGEPIPLDASHGVGPGWMVPPNNIYRWQAWGLDGKPVNVRPSKFQGLHGYVRTGPGASRGPRPMMSRSMYARRRGIGDLCSDFGIGCDVAAAPIDQPYLQDSTPLYSSGSLVPPAASSGFLNNLVGNAASVAKVIGQPTTTVTYPGGATVTGPAGSVPAAGALAASSFSSVLPILGIGLLGLVLVSSMGKK